MTNKLFLIDNQCYQAMQLSEQEWLLNALRMVCGSKTAIIKELSAQINAPGLNTSIFVYPVDLLTDQKAIVDLLADIEKLLPLKNYCGFLFALFSSSKKIDSNFWLEILDRFYDHALPAMFCCLKELNLADSFNITAACLSLFKSTDNLKELNSIYKNLHTLEQQIKFLELKLSKMSCNNP